MSLAAGTVRPQRPASVGAMFLDRVDATPDREAYRRPVGDRWESMSWREAGDRVQQLAAGLLDLGVLPEERVALICTTRVDWVLADFAIMCSGAATTTVYPTSNPEDVAYIVADSGAVVAFAEDDGQVAKLREHRDELPAAAHGRDLRRHARRRLGDRPRRAGSSRCGPARRSSPTWCAGPSQRSSPSTSRR